MNFDAFSSGQISSKLWLCEELEKLRIANPVIWILGGWYGLTGFLLLSRGRIPVRHIRSFDLDPLCQPRADLFNENWVWQDWRFKAFTADARTLDYQTTDYGPSPDIVINTSVEHIQGAEWWQRIPSGTLVALQSCDMEHADHHVLFENLHAFTQAFPLRETLSSGERKFQYPEWSFTRFLKIGRK